MKNKSLMITAAFLMSACIVFGTIHWAPNFSTNAYGAWDAQYDFSTSGTNNYTAAGWTSLSSAYGTLQTVSYGVYKGSVTVLSGTETDLDYKKVEFSGVAYPDYWSLQAWVNMDQIEVNLPAVIMTN